ncbi:hypothetical protein D3C72_1302080 [compost metagenome]
MGRASGLVPIAASLQASLRCARQPVVHEHPRAGRVVASRLGIDLARRPGHAGAAPRLAGSPAAGRGRAGPARWRHPLRGGHVQPGSGRGLSRRGPGTADRQSQGHRAAVAARRARAPSPGRIRPYRVRSLARAGAGGVRRRAPGTGRRGDRSAPPAHPGPGRAGPALRQLRARWRFRCRRVVGPGAAHARLRRAGPGALAGGAGLHRAGRPRVGAVPGLPQGGTRRRRHLPRTRPARGTAPPAVDRHHHQRWQRGGAVPAGRAAGCGGRAVRRSPAPGRSLPVCRAPAGTGAAGKPHRLCAPGQGR